MSTKISSKLPDFFSTGNLSYVERGKKQKGHQSCLMAPAVDVIIRKVPIDVAKVRSGEDLQSKPEAELVANNVGLDIQMKSI